MWKIIAWLLAKQIEPSINKLSYVSLKQIHIYNMQSREYKTNSLIFKQLEKQLTWITGD